VWHSTKRCSSIFDLGPLTPKIYSPKLTLWVIESVIVYMDVRHGSVGQSVHTKTCMWVGTTLVAMATTFGRGEESIAYRLVYLATHRPISQSVNLSVLAHPACSLR